MRKFEAAFAGWVLSHRCLILFLTVAAVSAATYGSKYLYFDSSYRVFFSEDNPQLMAFEAIENTYTKNDNVVIVVAPKDGNVFTSETLRAVADLTEEAWQIPFSNRVDSITNFQYTTAEDDDLIVRDMVDPEKHYTEAQLDFIREAVLSESALFKRLISEKGHVTGINVTLQMQVEERTTATPIVADHARQLAQRMELSHPGIDTYLTGMVMMDHAFSESALYDISYLVPISFVLMMILIAVLVGRFIGTFVTMAVIIFSILASMGVAGYLGYPLTGISTSAPIIILTVAVANCVHVLVTFTHGLNEGSNRLDAMEESIRVNLQPVFLASATTAIGFTSMNFSEVPPFGHLGTIVSMGVLFSFVLTVTFMPAMVTLLPVRTGSKKKTNDFAMTALAEFVIARRTALLWAMLIVIAAVVMNIPRNELNDVFVHYFDKNIQFRADTDFTVDNLTGVYINNYSLHAGESGDISNPDFLRDVEKLALWLETQPETIHVDRFTTVMKRLNKNMHGDDQKYYALPENRNLAAQYLLLYEMSLPYGLDLNNQINVDKSSTKLAVTVRVISSEEEILFDSRVRDWINENALAIKKTESGSTVLMFSHIGQRNVRAMLFGTTVALILISGILIIALQSLKIGLISLIPNLVPAAMGFGLWGIFVGDVGLSLSIVTGMSFGIVVDNTVHFLSKYLRAKRENSLKPEDAVRYAFRVVGKALVVTTITLVIGFSALATSNFSFNSDMGLLTAVIITIALVQVFLLLPPLLLKIEEKDDHAPPDGTRAYTAASV